MLYQFHLDMYNLHIFHIFLLFKGIRIELDHKYQLYMLFQFHQDTWIQNNHSIYHQTQVFNSLCRYLICISFLHHQDKYVQCNLSTFPICSKFSSQHIYQPYKIFQFRLGMSSHHTFHMFHWSKGIAKFRHYKGLQYMFSVPRRDRYTRHTLNISLLNLKFVGQRKYQRYKLCLPSQDMWTQRNQHTFHLCSKFSYQHRHLLYRLFLSRLGMCSQHIFHRFHWSKGIAKVRHYKGLQYMFSVPRRDRYTRHTLNISLLNLRFVDLRKYRRYKFCLPSRDRWTQRNQHTFHLCSKFSSQHKYQPYKLFQFHQDKCSLHTIHTFHPS